MKHHRAADNGFNEHPLCEREILKSGEIYYWWAVSLWVCVFRVVRHLHHADTLSLYSFSLVGYS